MLDGKGTAAVLVNGALSSKAILKAGLPGHQQEEQEVADEVLEDDFPEPPQYTVMGILQGGLSGRVSWSMHIMYRLGAWSHVDGSQDGQLSQKPAGGEAGCTSGVARGLSKATAVPCDVHSAG